MHGIKLTVLTTLKYIIQWFSVYAQTITTHSRTFHHSQKKPPPFSCQSQFCLQLPARTDGLSVELPVLDVVCRWRCTIRGLLCLACHWRSEARPRCSVCQVRTGSSVGGRLQVHVPAGWLLHCPSDTRRCAFPREPAEGGACF